MLFKKTTKTVLLTTYQVDIARGPFCIQNERQGILYQLILRQFLQLFNKTTKMLYFKKSPNFRRTVCTIKENFIFLFPFCFLLSFMFQEYILNPDKAQYFSLSDLRQIFFLCIRDLKMLPSFKTHHIYMVRSKARQHFQVSNARKSFFAEASKKKVCCCAS